MYTHIWLVVCIFYSSSGKGDEQKQWWEVNVIPASGIRDHDKFFTYVELVYNDFPLLRLE
jgi:hypothetical protein